MMDQKNKFIPKGIATEFIAEEQNQDAVRNVLKFRTPEGYAIRTYIIIINFY